VFSLLEYALPSYSPHLTSLTVNFPFIAKLRNFDHLKSLTIDIRGLGASHFLYHYPGISVGGYPPMGTWHRPLLDDPDHLHVYAPKWKDPWYIPSSLETLEVLGGSNTVPDDLQLNFGGLVLPNLKRLVVHMPIKNLAFNNFNFFDLAKWAPSLVEFDYEGLEKCKRMKWTFPPSLTKLRLAQLWSFHNTLELDPSALPNLTDLAIVHQTGYYLGSWEQGFPISNRKPWDLTPLLNLHSLVRLKIGSIDYRWGAECETFLLQLATQTPKQPIDFLDVSALFLAGSVIEILRAAFPLADIRFKTRVFEKPLPKRAGDENINYAAYVGLPLVGEFYEPNPPVHSTPLGDPSSCPDCLHMVGSLMHQDHRSVCPAIQRPCVLEGLGCSWRGSTTQLRNHIPICAFNIVKCMDCHDSITRAQHQEHAEAHERARSSVRPSVFRHSTWHAPIWQITDCIGCKQSFSTRQEAYRHECNGQKRETLLEGSHDFWLKLQEKKRKAYQALYSESDWDRGYEI
jgi:hypothetical protein